MTKPPLITVLQYTQMKFLFDARYIRTDFHDGISRYSLELGRALATQTNVTFIICDPKQRALLPEGADTVMIHSPSSPREPLTAMVLNKFKPDIVFSPMQTMGAVGRRYKLILTAHDMIYFRHRTPPLSLSPLIRLGWRLYHLTYTPQRLLLNSADLVATVSHTVKREFEQTKLTHRPIIVVPNAPQRFTKPAHHRTPVANIIYMGSFMPYKNVEALVKAMQWLPGKTLHLLSRVSDKRRAEIEAIIPHGAHVEFHGGVSDEQYEHLLASNAILATASYDEGYGLPIAEALAMGVPVAVSDIPIFHEVAAGGGVYFDPDKPKDIARAISSIDKKAVRDRLIEKGRSHMATFTWEASARELLNAARSLL